MSRMSAFTNLVALGALLLAGYALYKAESIKRFVKVASQAKAQPAAKGAARGSAEFWKLNREWAEKVIGGGYILHFRHAHRNKYTDVMVFDMMELLEGAKAEELTSAAGNCLTSRGKHEAELLGRMFRFLKINVSKVYSSPSCRARQTAKYAFGDDYEVEQSIFNRTAVSPRQFNKFAEEQRRFLLSLKTEPGANIVLTGHKAAMLQYPNLIDQNDAGPDNRKDLGFYVMSAKDGKIVLHHKFTQLSDFARSVLMVP